jgi:hypothetical protein
LAVNKNEESTLKNDRQPNVSSRRKIDNAISSSRNYKPLTDLNKGRKEGEKAILKPNQTNRNKE